MYMPISAFSISDPPPIYARNRENVIIYTAPQ
jgi:hypothetical protein